MRWFLLICLMLTAGCQSPADPPKEAAPVDRKLQKQVKEAQEEVARLERRESNLREKLEKQRAQVAEYETMTPPTPDPEAEPAAPAEGVQDFKKLAEIGRQGIARMENELVEAGKALEAARKTAADLEAKLKP